jgi:hypothetical protein
VRRIAPGSCPGGLVAVLFDDDGTELQRAELTSRARTSAAVAAVAAETHAEHVRDEGGSVCIFDGDSGRPLLMLLAGAVLVFGPLP